MTTEVYCRRISLEDAILYLQIFSEREESTLTSRELVDAFLAAAIKKVKSMAVISHMDVMFCLPNEYTKSIRDMSMSATKLFSDKHDAPYDNLEEVCQRSKKGHMELILSVINGWDSSVTSIVRDGIGYLLYINGTGYGCKSAMDELGLKKIDFVVLRGDVDIPD